MAALGSEEVRQQLAAALAMAQAQVAERDATLAERDASLAERDATLAASRVALAALGSEHAERVKRLEHLVELAGLRPELHDLLFYVARAGHEREAEAACGVDTVAWRLDANLWRGLVRARHGELKQTRLHWACEKGLLPRVIELLEWKTDIEAADEEDATPLHLASGWGRLEVVRELVRRGAKVGAKTKNGDTPLHDASFYGNVEVARLLLDSGADIEAKGGGIECTPLYQASEKGKLEVVQLLVARGAVVDARAEDGWTSLMKASEKGHAPVVRALLAAGADVRARNNHNRTALHWASYHGRTEALRELLKSHDAELNAQDDDGDSPLMDACTKGHLMAATALIAFGADVNLLNNAGRSPLAYARALPQSKAQRALVAILEERGAR